MKFAAVKRTAASSALAVSAVLTTGWVHALPDDRSKPIEIQANSAERDAKTGITTYTGNVDIRQGSIHIAAGSVVLNSKNNELTEINASGSPATYKQQLTGPDDTVNAQANNIHFDVAKDLVTLLGNSSLKQQSGNISGERIEYDIKTERVKAQAAEAGSADNTRRITVVIPPSPKTKDESSADKKNDTSKKESAKP